MVLEERMLLRCLYGLWDRYKVPKSCFPHLPHSHTGRREEVSHTGTQARKASARGVVCGGRRDWRGRREEGAI